jgi:PKD repeat protein
VVEDGQQVDISLSSTCGPTVVPGGMMVADTTWTPECSPYIISGNLLVPDGITLTVLPGTTVRFDPAIALQVDGRLDAQGMANAMIVFTASGTPAPGAWGYILLREPTLMEGHDLTYALVEYGGGVSTANNAALRIEAAWPALHDITVRYSAADGVRFFDGGGGSISYADIHHNAGWGLNVTSGSLSAVDSALHVHHNTGGGIYISGAGPVWLSGSVIRENTGHGIEASGTALDLYVSNCLIQGNTANSNGAGIYISNAALELSDSWVIGNTAQGTRDGGGIDCYGNSSSCLVEHNIILGNTAGDQGGGIYTASSGTVATVRYNVISGNAAARGGGLAVYYAALTSAVHNNAFLDNTATGNGAALWVAKNIPLTYNTILHNTAGPDLGAIYAKNQPVFNANNIYDNSDYDLYNDNPQGAADLNAELNWWGTDDPGLIMAHIWDWYDNSGLGLVDWDPWLTGHVLAAPISPPLGLTASTDGSAITLSWWPNPESDLTGYKVYYDTSPGFPYTGAGALEGDSPVDVGNVTSFTLTGLPAGRTYYLAVTAYDTASDGVRDQTEGHESWFSGEATVQLPGEVQADFTATPTAGPAPLAVSFTNLSAGNYATCAWTFGDGGTSNACVDPDHTYTTPGSYTVSLTVSGPGGSDTLTRPGYISVFEPVDAQFLGSPTTGVRPLMVTFTNQSTGDYTTCAWTFGDGGTSSSCGSPIHTYTAVGAYTVALTVSGPGGTSTRTRSDYITVSEGYRVYVPLVLRQFP